MVSYICTREVVFSQALLLNKYGNRSTLHLNIWTIQPQSHLLWNYTELLYKLRFKGNGRFDFDWFYDVFMVCRILWCLNWQNAPLWTSKVLFTNLSITWLTAFWTFTWCSKNVSLYAWEIRDFSAEFGHIICRVFKEYTFISGLFLEKEITENSYFLKAIVIKPVIIQVLYDPAIFGNN